jgi:hypothetical protein
MALLPGSPALNAGDPNELGAADQRGVIRSGGVNIGAYQASASAFVLSAPAKVTTGVPFDLTVTAVDPFGQVAVGYTGTVTFSTTDPNPGVVLPADYTFTSADAGVHAFSDTGLGETTLVTPGFQLLTVADMADRLIFGQNVVMVQAMDHPGGGSPSVPSDPGVAAPLFPQIHEPQVVRTEPGVEPASIAAAAQVARSQRAGRNAVEGPCGDTVDEAKALEARLLWADLVPQ